MHTGAFEECCLPDSLFGVLHQPAESERKAQFSSPDARFGEENTNFLTGGKSGKEILILFTRPQVRSANVL
jgi:hypothetical protein